MKGKTASVAEACESVGLNIHRGISNILEYNTENTDPVTLDGKVLGKCKTFIYLGSFIDEQVIPNADVMAKTSKLRAAFLQLENLWISKLSASKRHI